jgi:hypothetical protein
MLAEKWQHVAVGNTLHRTGVTIGARLEPRQFLSFDNEIDALDELPGGIQDRIISVAEVGVPLGGTQSRVSSAQGRAGIDHRHPG